MPYQIEFEPIGRRGECAEGSSLLDCARRLGVGLVSICGGQGKCYACKVQVVAGSVNPPTSTDKKVFSEGAITVGWRLACLTYPQSDCTLQVPPESMTTLQRMQVEGLEVSVPPQPAVKTYSFKLSPPSLHDLRSDATRVYDALKQQKVDCDQFDINALRQLSPKLRELNWEVQAAVRGREIIAVTRPGTRPMGLAVDVGTTKIAGYLVDLATGETLASRGAMNPQIAYGEDITSRMVNAMKSPEEAARLQKLETSGIDQLAAELCIQAKANRDEILDSVIVGNTAIHHLMLGLPVKQLAFSPFVANVQEPLDVKACDMGLTLAPGAYVHILSNVAGYVGADHISDLLAIDAANINETTLAIDIGTNTEVSLLADGKIFSASCASGPAFEGGHILHGMRAASGAIERLKMVEGVVDCQTIDNAPPVGVCGSGVIDALAQFYLAGTLDSGGRIKAGSPFVREAEGHLEIELAKKADGQFVVMTQHDIRELQLAKAAIRGGIQVLLETAGIAETDIRQVIIAGAFGTYIDVSSAITIGMLPSLPLDRFRQIGNSAGLGAKIALISKPKRAEAKMLAEKVRYVELATAPNFMKTFMQAGYLGLFRLENGKRKEISNGD
jgi:uncharacterized 2Fe-2S/4Fe-4S cluster protein (DUF4445 family)